MREEHVTKTILKWLLDNHWEILCYDFHKVERADCYIPMELTKRIRARLIRML